MKKVIVLGAGVWGKTLGQVALNAGCAVKFWNRTPQDGATSCLQEALHFSSHGILSLSAQHIREVLWKIKDVGSLTTCFIASKGVERGTGALLSELVHEILPSCSVGVLSGPNLAREVQQGLPCGLTVASQDPGLFTQAVAFFTPGPFWLERSTDLIGVQVVGAMKNAMAIGYGLLQQTCASENVWATFLVLAMQEIGVFVHALGGDPKTVLTFAGVGDLVLTSHSAHGRNSQFGRQFGTPLSHESKSLVEGVATLEAILTRGASFSLPILQGIHQILTQQLPVQQWPFYLQKVAEIPRY